MVYKYALQEYEKKNMAIASGRDLPISTKHSIAISTWLRKKKLEFAKKLLNEVIKLRTPVPFTRFNHNMGHRKGKIASGRYPINAASAILAILESAEKNALQKGLSINDLIIDHICAHRASRSPNYGRIRGTQNKRTHIEVMLKEGKVSKKTLEKSVEEKKQQEKPKPAEKTESKKETPAKPEIKKVEKAEIKKEEVKKAEKPKTEVKEEIKKPKEEAKK